MSVLDQLNRADDFTALWEELMPDVEVPDRSQFVLWAGTYTDAQVCLGINRAAAKTRQVRDVPMTSEDAAKYASSVMFHESRGHRRFEPKVTTA